MNFAGDVPEAFRELAAELVETEKEIDELPNMPAHVKAKSYTLLAHDWYAMDLEEQGHKLLLKADGVYPNYFSGRIADHIIEDERYGVLVSRLTDKLLTLTSDYFGKMGD